MVVPCWQAQDAKTMADSERWVVVHHHDGMTTDCLWPVGSCTASSMGSGGV